MRDGGPGNDGNLDSDAKPRTDHRFVSMRLIVVDGYAGRDMILVLSVWSDEDDVVDIFMYTKMVSVCVVSPDLMRVVGSYRS